MCARTWQSTPPLHLATQTSIFIARGVRSPWPHRQRPPTQTPRSGLPALHRPRRHVHEVACGGSPHRDAPCKLEIRASPAPPSAHLSAATFQTPYPGPRASAARVDLASMSSRGGDGLEFGWCALKSPAAARSASSGHAASAVRGERFLSRNSCKPAESEPGAWQARAEGSTRYCSSVRPTRTAFVENCRL